MAALKKLQLQDFIAKNQAKFLAQIKENLTFGEFIVIIDFSKNYSFVLKDQVQSFHWKNIHKHYFLNAVQGEQLTHCHLNPGQSWIWKSNGSSSKLHLESMGL